MRAASIRGGCRGPFEATRLHRRAADSLPESVISGTRILTSAAAACTTAAAFSGCGGDDAPAPLPRAEQRPGLAQRPFAPDGVWNRPLPADAAVDPRSEEIVAALRAQVSQDVARRYGPTINTWQYSAPVYEVPRRQRRVRVTLDNRATYAATLRSAIASVPIPRHARPARGSDKHMVIWQRSTDTMWEFWKMERRSDGWHAAMAGRMTNVSRNPGYFSGPSGFPWGATATSLPLLGGLMTPRELRRGRIDHALALAIPRPKASVWSLPAQRTDGWDKAPGAVPEGARFRLDPAVDVDELGLPRAVRAMALAAQRYGIIVRDKAGTVAFYAEDPASVAGADPYRRVFGREPLWQQLSRFPWDKLQLMKMELRTYRGPGK
jgi:hypothetical protein